MKKAIIDFETTGFGSSDRVIEIAVLVFDSKGIIDSFSQLINPGIAVPEKITQLTGITTEMLVINGVPFKEIIPILNDFLYGVDLILAHYAAFDKRFMDQEMNLLGKSFNANWACTVQLAKDRIKGLKSYSLKSLCEYYKIRQGNAHRALSDVQATHQLYKKLTT